ncbi:MAG: fasciclin domain-containing protein, partial [Bacteroidales bacterium]
ALPDGLLDDLLTDPTGDLADILLYHVVAGQSLSTDLTDGQVIETVLGQDITVTINDDGVFINDAQVILADLEAENGVVHVIDAVLIFDTNVESLAGQTANLNVFPNPVRDNMNLTFEMQSAENVVIEIFNIAGVKVFSIDHDNASDNVNIDVSDLSQGTYILNIRNQNEVITRKINVVR